MLFSQGSPGKGTVDPLGLSPPVVPPPMGPFSPDAPVSAPYTAPDGQQFYAPPSADFCAEEAAGRENGVNPWAMNAAIGQSGQFDYQRSGGHFYRTYTNAANFGVGVYMYGAGFSESEMNDIGGTYSFFRSSNANAASQTTWWGNGWKAASNGSLGCGCGKRGGIQQ